MYIIEAINIAKFSYVDMISALPTTTSSPPTPTIAALV